MPESRDGMGKYAPGKRCRPQEIFMSDNSPNVAPKRDPKAPKFLEVTVKDSDGKPWATFYAQAKEFSTGSVGYYISDKATNPESGERYQCGLSFTLIGSKPGK
jgi:hypothetical protein